MPSSTTNHLDAQMRHHLIGAAPLRAECTVYQIRPDEWLALGSLRQAAGYHEPPATVLVGQGASEFEALTQIERTIEIERYHPEHWSASAHRP